MLRLEEVLQLKAGEDVRLVAKRHGITILPGLFTAFLFIVIPFFFLFPLFSTGPAGAVVFLVFILTGLIIAWRTFAMWDGDALIITTLRLVKVTQTGIFARTVNEVPLSSILEVSWSKKGISGHLFNHGVVRVLAGQEMLMKKVPQPQQLHALIMDLVSLAKKSHVSDNYLREHRISKIQKMLQEMDDRGLREIEHMLERGERSEIAQHALFQDIKPISPNIVHAPVHHQDHHSNSTDTDSDTDNSEIRIKTLFGEDRTTRLKLMDE